MKLVKREKYDAMLPATPCYRALKERIAEIAKSEGMSVAEVQRNAFEFFLSSYDNSIIPDGKYSIKMEVN